jgi:glc operon protein GlcG
LLAFIPHAHFDAYAADCGGAALAKILRDRAAGLARACGGPHHSQRYGEIKLRLRHLHFPSTTFSVERQLTLDRKNIPAHRIKLEKPPAISSKMSASVLKERKMKIICRACGLLAGLILCGSAAMAIETKPTITLDLAKKMAAGCTAKAKRENWKMNIAVVNDGAHLIYFEHMDGAFLGSINISQSKAITAANFPFTTRFFAELIYGGNGKPAKEPGLAEVPGLVAFPGGLPIMTGSNIQIGGIGVSGGTADQDEQCAKAGLDAVADDLK